MQWFGGRIVTFWQPITSVTEKWWRDSHIQAHIVGGVVWNVLARMVILHVFSFYLNLGTASGVTRSLAVGVWQATIWEKIQIENWRPELMTPPGKPGTGYPYLSAIWDTLFAILGSATLEAGVMLAGLV